MPENSMIQRLLTERATVWEKTKAHLDTVEAEGRSFTAEADETYTALNNDLSALDERIKSESDLARRNAAADAVRAEFAGVTPPPAAGEKVVTDADRFRSLISGEARSIEFRDQTVGSATGGGNLVPTGFAAQLREHMIQNSAIRQSNVSVIQTADGQSIQFPKTTTHPTAGILAEGATVTESNAVFGQVTLDAYKYGFSVQVSSELEQDSAVNLQEYLARIGGEAIGNGSGAHFVTGTGSSQPNGVVTASTLGVTGATTVSGAFDVDDLLDLYYSVIPSYRARGSWILRDSSIKAARKLKDGTSGDYLWNNSVLADEPSTLLGRPVLADPNVAATATSAKSVIFGDLSAYLIRDVAGVRVERSTEFAFQNDLVTYRFLFRTDGDLLDTTGAVKHFIGGAS